MLLQSVHQSLEPSFQIEHRAYESAYAQAQNKEYGVLAVGHVAAHSIESQGETGQPHGCEHDFLPLGSDMSLAQGSYEATRNDGNGVDNGSYHILLRIVTKIDRKCGMRVSFQLSFPNFKHEKKI